VIEFRSMKHYCSTNFPDEKYLEALVEFEKDRVERNLSSIERLVMYSGASINSIGAIFTDPDIQWQKKELLIKDLVLTRTNPKWNEVIVDLAKGSPTELSKLILEREDVAALFADVRWDEMPILVLDHEGLRVFDGMNRTIAAIRDRKDLITAWVATSKTKTVPKPVVEPHVLYDFLRAYKIHSNRDRDSLVAALQFLKKAYSNVDLLLEKRFGPDWVPDDELQSIIEEVLSKD